MIACLRYRYGHAPVLERAGRIQAFKFAEDTYVLSYELRQFGEFDQRGVAFI